MNRDEMISRLLHSSTHWDVIVIGGGATGLGIAVDASSRGFRTLLLEQGDFAEGTSSRSTKLIHGGLRYLQQGNISLVTEALRERGFLCKNAPHIVHPLPFLIPLYHWWETPFYGIGLKVYDMLAGKLSIEPSKQLSREATLKAIPNLKPEGLRGGIIYYDGQFDDSRLAITLAQTAADHGACLINYMKVVGLIKENTNCIGVKALDEESKTTHKMYASAIINATGVFSDQVRKLDDLKAGKMIAPSQGIHLVVDASFLPGKNAILVPHTKDKRVIFMVPWHGAVLIGTTDTPVREISYQPKPLKKEIKFLLQCASQYLVKIPKEKDILSVFTGLRPLVKAGKNKNTSALSRDHTLLISKSGMISIAGGKWTTYRKMAEDALDFAIANNKLPARPCKTKKIRLHGWAKMKKQTDHLGVYGTDINFFQFLAKKDDKLNLPMHPDLPYRKIDLLWAVKHEMARTVDDLLSRRTRALFLNVRASLEIAPAAAELLAKELGRTPEWTKKQVQAFKKIAKKFLN